MSHINIEIKARSTRIDEIRKFLLENGAEQRGIDHQTDTYFNVASGRLKLREGNIENNLIYYHRPDHAGPKQSDFTLVKIEDKEGLKAVLENAIGVKITVQKKREIYFIKNVKFHLDSLEKLGSFVEIEAGNKDHDIPVEKLHEQCAYYMTAFGIKTEDLLDRSYSDMLIEVNT